MGKMGLKAGSEKPIGDPHNDINERALIGQSAMVYCAGKPMKNRASSELQWSSARGLRIPLVSSTNIPRGLSAYKPHKLVVNYLNSC